MDNAMHYYMKVCIFTILSWGIAVYFREYHNVCLHFWQPTSFKHYIIRVYIFNDTIFKNRTVSDMCFSRVNVCECLWDYYNVIIFLMERTSLRDSGFLRSLAMCKSCFRLTIFINLSVTSSSILVKSHWHWVCGQILISNFLMHHCTVYWGNFTIYIRFWCGLLTMSSLCCTSWSCEISCCCCICNCCIAWLVLFPPLLFCPDSPMELLLVCIRWVCCKRLICNCSCSWCINCSNCFRPASANC